MFCTNCGNKLDVNGNFCGQCGKAVRTTVTPKPGVSTQRFERPIMHEPIIDPEPKYTPPPVAPVRSKTAEAKTEKKREELRAELKKIMEKERGHEVTDAELFEAEHWLRGYADLMLDLGVKEAKRQEKLKKNPDGFHLEGEGYTCFICGGAASNEQSWFDKYGIKCMTCQDAVNKNIIPPTAASDKDSWYSEYDLEHSFCVNRFGIRRFVKEGLLKPRVILNESKYPHYQLFFIEDHEGVLPPKKLIEWPMVKVKKDGKDWYHTEPWFKHADAKEVLKGYKILDYLQTLTEKQIVKSFPQLSMQLSDGARTFYKINHIDKKVDK